MSRNIAEKFIENSEGFCQKYKWLIVIFAISLSCDCLSTVYFMYETGPETELHPAVRYSSIIFGTVTGPLIGATMKAITGIAVAVYLRRFAFYILFTGSVVSFWAAWYNIWGYTIYTPYLFKVFRLV